MSTPAPFYRGLSPAFLNALSDLADRPEDAWWRDVLTRTAAAPDGCGLRLYAVGSTAGRRSAAFVK